MADLTLPRSPFAGNIDFPDDAPVRSVAPEKLSQILREHELYVVSEQRSGKRANLDSTDLTGKTLRRYEAVAYPHATSASYRSGLRGRRSTASDTDRGDDATRTPRGGRSNSRRLSGINLTDADCAGACLAEVDIEFAIMANADFRDADFHDADMSGVILDGADLSGANLRRANLRGASFQNTRLCGADLRGARMGGAFLKYTSFKGTDLRGAYLRVARFHRTDLSGADLRGVEGLTRQQIDDAIRDADTRLPLDLITEHEDGD